MPAYADLIPDANTRRICQQYTPEQVQAAAIVYAQSGIIKRTSENTGIPIKTLHDWKHKSEVWADALAQYRQENTDKHVAVWDKIITRSTELANQSLDSIEIKTANDVKALVMCEAISQDKQRLLMGLPNSISSTTDDSKLLELQKKFEALAGKTVEGEVVD